MKILKLTKFVAVALCLCSMFTACSSSDDGGKDEATNLPLPGGDGKMYTVSLDLENEKFTSSESPLPVTSASKASRVDATGKTLYGINVYYAGSDGTYNTYAYGLFDDKSKIKINLQGGYKYKFECTSVHELDDKVWHSDKNEYLAPFNRAGFNSSSSNYSDAITILSNSFVSSVGTAQYMEGIEDGLATISYNASSKNATSRLLRTDRYYGETKDYDPTKGDGTVTIKLNRAAFGLAYNITPPKEGTLTVSATFSPNISEYSLNGDITVSSTEKVNKQVSYIYPFRNVASVAMNTNIPLYTQYTLTLTATWTKSDGSKETFTKNITAKRNVLTTVNIDISKPSGDPSLNPNSQFNIVEESTPMTNETVDF